MTDEPRIGDSVWRFEAREPAPDWAVHAIERAHADPSDLIEVEDANGNRVTVTRKHYDRWPSVRETFRPVADNPDTTVSTEPPTGDKTEE